MLRALGGHQRLLISLLKGDLLQGLLLNDVGLGLRLGLRLSLSLRLVLRLGLGLRLRVGVDDLLILDVAHRVLVPELLFLALVQPVQVQQDVGDIVLAIVGGKVVNAGFLRQCFQALEGPAALLLLVLLLAVVGAVLLGGFGFLAVVLVFTLVVVRQFLLPRRRICVCGVFQRLFLILALGSLLKVIVVL